MENLLDSIYNLIKDCVKIKILYQENGCIVYYYEYIYKLKDKKTYCYWNLRKFCSSIITLFIFIIFYSFNINIVPLPIIDLIKILLSIFFFINILRLIYNLILGLWEKIYKYDEERYDEALTKLFKYINFLINISLIYYIFNLDINLLLQYNIMFVVDFIGVNIVFFYSYLYKYEIRIKPVQNFINYSFFSLIILYLSLYSKSSFKYWFGSYLTDYIFVFSFEVPFNNKNNIKEIE